MNKPKFIFKAFLFFLVLSATQIFAQTDKRAQAEPCYEIVLQILVASNGADGKAQLPPTLTNVIKRLKNQYAFTDYRLTTTFLQRTTSQIEYKSLLNEFNLVSDKNYPAFSEWSLRGLQSLPNAQGKNVLQFENFRFGMRIPIVRNVAAEDGKTTLSPIYDSIGITTARFNINENEPTIVGSLATAKPDELMFLVLTVKAAE